MCCTRVSWSGEMYDLDVSHLQFLYAYLVCIKCRISLLPAAHLERVNQSRDNPISIPWFNIEYILLHSWRNLSRAKLATSN